MSNALSRAKNVKCLICDVDGVLTDGRLYLDNHGNELKAFHVQDGMGLKLLLSAGIEVAVITTSRVPIIQKRMEQLGIKHFYTGQVDKRDAYDKLKDLLKLDNASFGYIGDDLPDLPIIKQVGFGVAVANAVPLVKEFAVWETTKNGGLGGVREVCDYILNSQNKTEQALEGYLKS